MNDTSLSASIEALHDSWNSKQFDDLVALFRASSVGIRADGVPPEHLGQKVKITSEKIALGSKTHGDGKSRVMAFADPEEFIAKFGLRFNGEMLGDELFNVVLHNPECCGILLNSAKAEVSVRIDRDYILNIRHTGKVERFDKQKKGSWWKFWK